MDSDSESKLFSLISQLLLVDESTDSDSDRESVWELTIIPLILHIISVVRSMDLDLQPKPESKLMSLISQTISLFNSMELDSLPKPLSNLISFISQKISSDSDQKPKSDLNFESLVLQTLELEPEQEFVSLIREIISVVDYMETDLKNLVSLCPQVEVYSDSESDSDSESKLISLISQLRRVEVDSDSDSDGETDLDSVWESEIIPLIIQIISVVRSMDFDVQTKPESKLMSKPESKLMSLVSQANSLFKSMDLDSLPKPLSKLISLISQKISPDSDQKPEFGLKLKSLVWQTLELKPDPEVVSLIRQIVSVVEYMDTDWKNLISLFPQVEVHRENFLCVTREVSWTNSGKWDCFLNSFQLFSLTGEGSTHFLCRSCKGEYHNEYEKVPVKIKHPLHPKHSLQLAINRTFGRDGTRECYCCDEHLMEFIYFCSACDFALNIACVEKPQVLSIPLSKWHDHQLALFPIKTSLTCDICALATSNSPIYICPPCAFVAHLKCINLPRVIRISRHLHRLWHTPSFEEGDWSCGVCRRKVDNDYGGYSCVKDGCSYAAHSRCATQRNVWDGIDLHGEPEETEEEVAEPFVTISDGIIQHFSHDHHHLRLDENTCRDYDDNKLCQACVTPIYFGNFYSCVQCEFVLHETCAHLSRKMYHPIHPHLLTLATVIDVMDSEYTCAACHRSLSTAGFLYECGECGKKECYFRLHVQCATISEPLVHISHVHPLFLTSKPEEKRKCSVCGRGGIGYEDVNETFNCIDECDDFALCFRCATLPQKLSYKHDKHILSLSFGEETDTVTYWCEVCEGKINPEEGFYMCDEYCCVTLHVYCLIGRDLYMKPGSLLTYITTHIYVEEVGVQSNNHHMTRPICDKCEKRCAHKIVFQCRGSIFCSLDCL